MENPLLEALIKAGVGRGICRIGDEEQHALCKKYAWTCLDDRALEAIVQHSPLIEIGGGTGYHKSLLEQAGADIISFDREPYFNDFCEGQHSEVLVGGPEKILDYPDRNLYVSRAPYGGDPYIGNPYCGEMALDCLDAWLKGRSEYFIWVGEGRDGKSGTNEFFDLLYEATEEVEAIDIPTFYGGEDRVEIYRRLA